MSFSSISSSSLTNNFDLNNKASTCTKRSILIWVNSTISLTRYSVFSLNNNKIAIWYVDALNKIDIRYEIQCFISYSLVANYLQCVSILETISDHFAFGMCIKPAQFASIVLTTVEICKPLITLFQLGWQSQWQNRVKRPTAWTQNHYIEIDFWIK